MRGRRYVYVTKTLDMHQPYPYYATKWEDTPESFRNNPIVTIHGIHWVDRTLEKFFTDAEREGLWDDRTLFIITSDHNPHSGGEYTKLVDNPADRQSIAPIPLLFVAKNVEPLQFLNRSAYASQIDLAPTLLCLLGIEPPRRFLGRNLLQTYLEPDNALGFSGTRPTISRGPGALSTRSTNLIRPTIMRTVWPTMSCILTTGTVCPGKGTRSCNTWYTTCP